MKIATQLAGGIFFFSTYTIYTFSNKKFTVTRGLFFFIIIVSNGKFDNSMGVRKRTDWNLVRI